MKNDATHTSSSTIASTVNAVGNLNFFASGGASAGPGSGCPDEDSASLMARF